MRGCSAVFVALIVVVAAACEGPLTDAPRPTPAIALLLVVGETLQVASVSVATPADSILPPEGVPVGPGNASLWVADDTGGAWPIVATATPGRFEVVLSPGLGRQYTLQGTVLGRSVAATTAVPQRFDIVSLPNDTITTADSVPCRFSFGAETCFRIEIDSDQPTRVLCFLPPDRAPSVCAGTDQSQLRVPASSGAHPVLILGYTSDAFRSRLDETITRFGSAVLERRTAIFP